MVKITLTLLLALGGSTYYFYTQARVWEAQAIEARRELATALESSCQKTVQNKASALVTDTVDAFKSLVGGE